MRKVLVGILSIVFCLPAVGQPMSQPGQQAGSPATVHDGTWWKEKSGTFKEGFLVGFKEGAEQSAPSSKRSVWTTTKAKPLMEGLNEFYKDFRNTNIYIDEAITYVQDELQGATDEALKAELQKLRQAAAARKE